MEHIQLERNNAVLLVKLARGKANALNQDMLEELHDAVSTARQDESVHALVLASDNPRFFSAGFDVREVFYYDPARMERFFGRFIDLYEGLHRFGKPVVAAMNGHTYAGGAILAIACDFRVMAETGCEFALNEINLGLSFSPGFMAMLMAAVGQAQARWLVLTGEPITPALALEIGLVRELAPAAQVRERAMALATMLARKPPAALRETRRLLEASSNDRAGLPRFTEQWFSREATECRRQLSERMA
jgi:enoyl-CoA hydratase/carnithine racemase